MPSISHVIRLRAFGKTAASIDASFGNPLGLDASAWAKPNLPSVDSAPLLQAAIDAVAADGGGSVMIPAGTYYLQAKTTGGNSRHLSIPSNVTLAGAGRETVLRTEEDARIFFIGEGSIAHEDYTYYLIDAALANAMSVTLDDEGDGVNFAAGDYVYIRTGQLIGSGTTEPDAELNQVVDVDGDTINLRWPLAKPYAQEYFISGTEGQTSTSVTANAAILGIANITANTTRNVGIRDLSLISTGNAPVVGGGHLVGLRWHGCYGESAGNFASMGDYRHAWIHDNEIYINGAVGSQAYAFSVAKGTSDVVIRDNHMSGKCCVKFHAHEGASRVKVVNNTFLSTPTDVVQNVIDFRARYYEPHVLGNTVINGGSSIAIRLDDSGVGGIIDQNVVRGGPFTTAISGAGTGTVVGASNATDDI